MKLLKMILTLLLGLSLTVSMMSGLNFVFLSEPLIKLELKSSDAYHAMGESFRQAMKESYEKSDYYLPLLAPIVNRAVDEAISDQVVTDEANTLIHQLTHGEDMKVEGTYLTADLTAKIVEALASTPITGVDEKSISGIIQKIVNRLLKDLNDSRSFRSVQSNYHNFIKYNRLAGIAGLITTVILMVILLLFKGKSLGVGFLLAGLLEGLFIFLVPYVPLSLPFILKLRFYRYGLAGAAALCILIGVIAILKSDDKAKGL